MTEAFKVALKASVAAGTNIIAIQIRGALTETDHQLATNTEQQADLTEEQAELLAVVEETLK